MHWCCLKSIYLWITCTTAPTHTDAHTDVHPRTHTEDRSAETGLLWTAVGRRSIDRKKLAFSAHAGLASYLGRESVVSTSSIHEVRNVRKTHRHPATHVGTSGSVFSMCGSVCVAVCGVSVCLLVCLCLFVSMSSAEGRIKVIIRKMINMEDTSTTPTTQRGCVPSYLGWSCFSPSLLPPCGWCCFPASFWVVLLSSSSFELVVLPSSSFFGWCCRPPPLEWCCISLLRWSGATVVLFLPFGWPPRRRWRGVWRGRRGGRENGREGREGWEEKGWEFKSLSFVDSEKYQNVFLPKRI